MPAEHGEQIAVHLGELLVGEVLAGGLQCALERVLAVEVVTATIVVHATVLPTACDHAVATP